MNYMQLNFNQTVNHNFQTWFSSMW